MDAERVFFAGPRFPAAVIELRVRASVVSVFAANIDDSTAALLAAASGAGVIISSWLAACSRWVSAKAILIVLERDASEWAVSSLTVWGFEWFSLVDIASTVVWPCPAPITAVIGFSSRELACVRIVADADEAGAPVGWEAQNWRVTRAASGGGLLPATRKVSEKRCLSYVHS